MNENYHDLTDNKLHDYDPDETSWLHWAGLLLYVAIISVFLIGVIVSLTE